MSPTTSIPVPRVSVAIGSPPTLQARSVSEAQHDAEDPLSFRLHASRSTAIDRGDSAEHKPGGAQETRKASNERVHCAFRAGSAAGPKVPSPLPSSTHAHGKGPASGGKVCSRGNERQRLRADDRDSKRRQEGVAIRERGVGSAEEPANSLSSKLKPLSFHFPLRVSTTRSLLGRFSSDAKKEGGSSTKRVNGLLHEGPWPSQVGRRSRHVGCDVEFRPRPLEPWLLDVGLASPRVDGRANGCPGFAEQRQLCSAVRRSAACSSKPSYH